MPAAASKPTSQNLEAEVQDPVKLLIGALEKKARNLEKRKTKLEGYKEMVSDGKTLNKDQQEAVSHFQEVQGNLNFAREFLVTIQAVVNETSKAKKKQERREQLSRQENEQQRLQNILLLQNVLTQMGQDHIRSDFLAGTNGAEKLEEQDLTFLDEFYPVVNPSREDEPAEEEATENGEEATPKEKQSFDQKMADAAVHLDKFLKSDESEICGTTYKYLHELVQRIHKCGYLDDVPAPPTEEVVEPAAAPDDQPEVDPVDIENTVVEEEYRPPSVASASMPISTPELPDYIHSVPVEALPQQQTQTLDDIPNAPEPIEMPPPKASQIHDVNEVIAQVEGGVTFFQESTVDLDSPHMDPAVVAVSMMPTQSYMTTPYQSNTDPSPLDRQGTPTHLEQPISGDAMRVQQGDSIYPQQPDPTPSSSYPQNIYEPTQQTTLPPSIPPQSSIPQQQHDYTSQQQPQNLPQQPPQQPGMGVSPSPHEGLVGMGSHQTGLVSQQTGMVTQQTGMVSQQAGMVSQQTGIMPQQGYMDRSSFAPPQNTGMGAPQGQSEYRAPSQQQDYGSSAPATQDYAAMSSLGRPQTTAGSGGVGAQTDEPTGGYGSQVPGEMRDYRHSPIDPQLNKQEERQSSSPSVYQQSSLQPSSQYSSSEITSNDGFVQTLQGSSQLNTEVQSMSTQGGSSSSPPPSIPFPNSKPPSSSKDAIDESQQLPKSTMNAAAPPFQSSTRASPQMQGLQSGTTEDSSFSSVASSTQPPPESSHLSAATTKEPVETRNTEYRSSPPNIAGQNDNSFQYSSYNNYQRNNRGRGGRGGPMGSPGYRNARGTAGMPFIRNPTRFNNSNMQRGGYTTGYLPQARDSFQPRAPDMGFHPQQATYQAFTRPQDTSYYRGGRGGMNRGVPRGGRGGTSVRGGPVQYCSRGGYQKPGAPLTA